MSTKRRSWLKAGPLALLLAAGLASPVLGQSVTATVTGVVQDNQGAILKGASVTAVNQNTGVGYPTKSNDAGVYTITGLPIGTYTLKVELPSFKTSVTNPFTLETNQIARVDPKMELGAITEELVVTDVQPILQADSAVVGHLITGNTAAALPLNGRNFAQLTLLVPGVQTTDTESFTNPTGVDNGRPSVNGHRPQENNFMLDGLDMNGATDNLIAYNPSPDALAEIRVETNNYSAEFGNVGGAIVSTVMKSGTNDFHGSAFAFARDDRFDANSWANKKNNADKSELSQQIYGGTLGGPLVKNKVFFFADYQGTSVKRPGGTSAKVAPEAWRRGDFSSLLPAVQLKDPRGGTFAGNIIPANRISPIAQAIISNTTNYPVPNAATAAEPFVYNTQQDVKRTANQGDVKIDANLSSKDNVSLRVSLLDATDEAGRGAFPLLTGGGNDRPSKSFAASWSRAFSSSAINELRVGFNQAKLNEGQVIDWGGIGDYNAVVGIPGGQRYAGLSQLEFSGAGIDNIGTTGQLHIEDDSVFQISEKLAFSKGRHFITTGAQLLHIRSKNQYPGQEGDLGQFIFTDSFTGHAFADFLLDQVSTKRIGGSAPWDQRHNRIAAFIQDDFKAASNLTINLGVRYEIVTPLVEANDRQVNFDLKLEEGGRVTGTGRALFAGSIPAGVCDNYKPGCAVADNRGLYKAYYGGISPRLGFAWTLDSKTVVRGGYGMVQYMEGTGAGNRLAQNPPFLPTGGSKTYQGGAAGSMAVGFSDTAAGALGALATGRTHFFQQDIKPQVTHMLNVFVERQVTNTTSLSVGYVGSYASRVAAFRNLNQAEPGTGPVSTWAPQEQRRRLFKLGMTGVGDMRSTLSDAEARYNGLQASLRRRRTKGLEFMASYTFSKAMQDNTGFYGGGWGSTANWNEYGVGGVGDVNLADPKAEYGPAIWDTKHNFSLAANYELPIGKGRSVGADWGGATQTLLGGWNVSAIVAAKSGFPITVNTGWASRSLQGHFAMERPDRVGNGQVDGFDWSNPEARWLDKSAFRETEEGTFGDSGVGILRGPGFWNVDLGLEKDFRFGDTKALTFRVEAFNVFNHANKGMPVRDFNSADFGKILYSEGFPRILEFALKLRF